MNNKRFLNPNFLLLGTICLCHLGYSDNASLASETPSSSYSYLSTLELKLEEMRHQLKCHQKDSAKITEGLSRISHTLEEMQAIRETVDASSTARYREITQMIDHFKEEKQSLLKSHEDHLFEREKLIQSQQELFHMMGQKADTSEISFSLDLVKSQLFQLQSLIDQKSSATEIDTVRAMIASHNASIQQLAHQLDALHQQKETVSAIQTFYTKTASQQDLINQQIAFLEKAHHQQEKQIVALQDSQNEQTQVKVPFDKQKGARAYAALLLLQAIEPNTTYAMNVAATEQVFKKGQFNAANQNTFKNLNFKWSPGYRLGAGYRNDAGSWDFHTELTYLRNTALNHNTPAATTQNPQPVTSSSQAALTYNVWDLSIDHPFYLNSSTCMQMLMGIRSAFIHQNWNVSRAYTEYEAIYNSWEMNGVGPRAGVSIDWLWNNSFGLNFQTSGGLTLGWISKNLLVMPTSISSITQNGPSKEQIFPVWDMSVGLKWRHQVQNSYINLFANWEMTQWIDLNQNYNFFNVLGEVPDPVLSSNNIGFSSTTSPLSLQGISLGISVDF